MLKKVFLLSCHNQYESKRYFSVCFSEALKRAGLEVSILSWEYGSIPSELVKIIKEEKPDLTITFHQLPPQASGQYFWDELRQPHWTILIDPVFYDLELMKGAFSIISCVDRDDCSLLLSYGFKNVFFFPHAIERDLFESDEMRKDIDILFLGTCYDPDNLRNFWKKKYPGKIVDILEESVGRVLNNRTISFWKALLQTLTINGVPPSDVEFDQLAYYVDQCARGIDRLQLIRSIKNAKIEVYGGVCWREEKPITDWSYYLSKQSNVILHPPVNYNDGLNLMKRAKICLNSMPFFKNGTHERVFAGIASGAVLLTSESLYLREAFDDEKDVLFYQFSALQEVNDKAVHLLSEEKRRKQMIACAQEKVRKNHTWDKRVEIMLDELPPILDRLPSRLIDGD